jgi:precorrin-2 dehydrogenase/sirohydrochlorin ferrochelatase
MESAADARVREAEQSMNFRYPIFVDVAGKRCLVAGAGHELPGKIHRLLEQGAIVFYVNPEAVPEIRALAAGGLIEWHRREVQPADVQDCFLVITDREDNSAIFEAAERNNILCNSVDDPEHCRFSFGSVLSRGDLKIAVSTNGIAPALAVRLRERLEREIGDEYALFVQLLGEVRTEIATSIPVFERRKALWYDLVDSDALQLIGDGRYADAQHLIRTLVEEAKGDRRVGRE